MIEQFRTLVAKDKTVNINDLFDETTLQEKNKQHFEKNAQKLLIVFGIVFAVIFLKLMKVQIFDHERYQRLADTQHEQLVKLYAYRGNIYDRNSMLIASNANYPSFVAYPKWISPEHRTLIASGLSKIFHKPESEYISLLSKEKGYVELSHSSDPIIAARVREMNLPQLAEIPFPHRVYNYEKLAAQLIGFTNGDNEAISGLELSLDSSFHGVDGEILLQRVGQNRTAARVDYPHKKAAQGNNVYLTIDVTIQQIVEEVLARTVTRLNAGGGLGIVMNIHTGEILSLGQYPFISPNDIANSDPQDQKPRAITDKFEPGSVFKLVVSAAALDDNLVRPDRVFTAGQKYFAPGRKTPITDSHSFSQLTFQEAFEHSSNIVMARISDVVGSERFYKMAKRLGFGDQTGIELPGEVGGDIKKPVYWSRTSLNTMAFGYEVSVTPIQILMAYAAIANDGVLLQPYIVKKIVSQDGTVIKEGTTHVVRRVVSEQTSAILKNFMEGVILRGTAKDTKVDGIRTAGKTGTAKKNINKHYAPGRYLATFAGFFPAENPEFAALVMIDDLHGSQYYAAQTAAPAFKEIVERMSATLGTPKKQFTDSYANPQVIAQEQSDATKKNIRSTKKDDRANISRLPVSVAKDSSGKIVIPNLFGMSVRQAMTFLSHLKMKFQIDGTGVVVKQFPEAGTPVIPGTNIKLTCRHDKIASLY